MKVLMLHDIRPFNSNFFPKRYSQHSFLTDEQFHNGISKIFQDILCPSESLSEGGIKNKSGYVLTFDDGLKDHLTVAEYLSEKKLKGIFFVPFGIIGSCKFINSHLIQFLIATEFDNKIVDDIYCFLQNSGMHNHQIDEYFVSRWKNSSWSKNMVFITRTLREALSSKPREQLLQMLLDKYLPINLNELHRELYLSWDDLRQISNMGHIIGAHGFMSMDLRFEEIEIIRSEIVQSKNALASINTNCNSNMMSYANGGCNDIIQQITAGAGFDFAFGTRHQEFTEYEDLLDIPRLDGTKLGLFE